MEGYIEYEHRQAPHVKLFAKEIGDGLGYELRTVLGDAMGAVPADAFIKNYRKTGEDADA